MSDFEVLISAEDLEERGITPPQAEAPAYQQCEFCGKRLPPMALISPFDKGKAWRWVGWVPCDCHEALYLATQETSKREVQLKEVAKHESNQIWLRKMVDAGLGRKWAELAIENESIPDFTADGYASDVLEGKNINAVVVGDNRLLIAAHILKAFIKRGLSCYWVSDGKMATVSFKDSAYDNMVDRMCDADVLFLQDIGTSVMSSYATGRLYHALQMRDSEGKVTVATVAGRYSPGRQHKANQEAILARIYGALDCTEKTGKEVAGAIVGYIMSSGYAPIYAEKVVD